MIRGSRSAQITEGTLVLKIARLEQHFKTLQKQQAVGDHQGNTGIGQLQPQYAPAQLQQVLRRNQ